VIKTPFKSCAQWSNHTANVFEILQCERHAPFVSHKAVIGAAMRKTGEFDLRGD
jgi:hypothetical protein